MGRGQGKGSVVVPALRSMRPATATLSDAASLLALKTQVIDEVYGPRYSEAGLTAWKERFSNKEYFRERFQASEEPTTFYYLGEPPRAMLALKVRDGKAYIGDIYVRERGQGLGSALLSHALQEARQQGFSQAVADTFYDNEAALQMLGNEGFIIAESYQEQSLDIPVYRLTLQFS